MKNANRVVYLVLCLLFVIMAVFVFINRGDAGLRRVLEENRAFQVRVDGEGVATVCLDDLLDLKPKEFSTIMSTSIGAPRQVTLKGVELRMLLDALEIDTSQAVAVIVSGLDGYLSPLRAVEVNKAENVYICYALNGEILKTQREGSLGPFLMVVRGDRFAQRWCKYIEAVDIIT